MVDRRKLDRKFLTYFARVLDRNNGLLLGYLEDLTTGGALLIGNTPLKLNEVFQLRIDLPDNFPRKEPLDIDARAMWSQPDEDPQLYRTGLKLVNVQPEEFAMLGLLISKYSAKGDK